VALARSIYQRNGGNVSHTADEMGIPRITVQGWKSRGLLDEQAEPKKPVQFAEIPEGIPIEDVIDLQTRRFQRLAKQEAAKKDFRVTIPEGGAFAVLAFGDPHLDDNGCFWPLLREHVEIAQQPHVYGFQVGDLANSWPEKLAKLWAEQDTSQDTMWQLVDWFLNKTGITWLPHLLGNHDRWNNGGRIIKMMAGPVPVFDWRGTFVIQNKDGHGFKMSAAHGFKGRSDWNELHELARQSRTGEEADVFISGHTHTFGIWDREIAERNYSAKLIKVRGYKFIDKYALHNGFAVHQRGAAVMIVFDPAQTEKAEQLTVFADPAKGLEYLQMVRAR
jgi:hypothetical protein